MGWRGACEVIHLQNGGGGGRISFSHVEGGGGHNKFGDSFYVVAWSFSHIEGGSKKFPVLKRMAAKIFTLSGGVGGFGKVLDPWFSHFVAPPSL